MVEERLSADSFVSLNGPSLEIYRVVNVAGGVCWVVYVGGGC